VPEAEVINMNRRLAGPDQSLNAPLREEGEGEWLDWLVSNDDNQEKVLGEIQEMSSRRQLLDTALDGLSSRERHIISERRLREAPATLQILSEQYGISRERVRQIEVRAFEKIRKSVKNAVIDRHINY
jgi:RNA polymerase sigma-32 factor